MFLCRNIQGNHIILMVSRHWVRMRNRKLNFLFSVGTQKNHLNGMVQNMCKNYGPFFLAHQIGISVGFTDPCEIFLSCTPDKTI